MAVLAPPMVIGIAWVADGWRHLGRRAARLAACAASGIAVAALAVLPAVSGAIDLVRTRLSTGLEAGWPLGLLSPLQTIGFLRFPSMVDRSLPGPSSLRYFVEIVLIGVIVAGATLALVRAHRPHPWLGGAAVLIVFVGYRVVYQVMGYSYQQWKFLSFFQPILSTGLVASVCAGVLVLVDRYELGRHRRGIVVGFGVVVASMWIGFLTARAHTFTSYDAQWSTVTPELIGLEDVGASRLQVVNVDLAPYWETMWGAYFLAPVPSRLRQRSYYAATPQTARWTVRGTKPDPGEPAPTPSLEQRQINREYELACGRVPCALRLAP
jgi:hypothetical protein